jgi:glycosyltransferase involved in cell wall biosynthesis
MLPTADLGERWLIEDFEGVQVLRLKAPRTKDIDKLRRTIGEFSMPFFMLRNLRKSPLGILRWDGVVWYSPSIFLGPMAYALKKSSGCRSYLILRDIFPQWALDMGLMWRGPHYAFFKVIEKFQYSVADVIGVQTPANKIFFEKWAETSGRRLEVLQNWLSEAPNLGCSIHVATSILKGRVIFVYAGNMGHAQGMDILLQVITRLRYSKDVGFLFVGRGQEARRLGIDAFKSGLDNVMFFDEIDPVEIPGLYTQCHVGLVSLDARHTTHNIPGKFLSYMQAGLPVLAILNPGNDLVKIIEREGVGHVCIDHSVDNLERLVLDFAREVTLAGNNNLAVSDKCKALAKTLFSTDVAVRQILSALAA